MSFKITGRILDESEEKLGRRLILLALAEAAHDDGVAWLSQETIARRGRLTRTYTTDLLAALERDGAIERRAAHVGRRRVTVYRLQLPGLPPVDYAKLPFDLAEPFSTTSDIPTSSRSTTSDPSVDDVGSSGSPRAPALSFGVEPSLEPDDLPTVGRELARADEVEAVVEDEPLKANVLVAEFLDEVARRGAPRPPGRYIAQVARYTKELLDEGIHPDRIRAGMEILLEKRLNPSLLANTVAEAALPPPGRPSALRYGYGVGPEAILDGSYRNQLPGGTR